MKRLDIVPNKCVGEIFLDMKQEDVEKILIGKHSSAGKSDSFYREFYEDHEIFIEYNSSGNVVTIELVDVMTDMYEVYLNGIEVFKTKAEKIVMELEKLDECIVEEPDKDLATEYVFENLGLTFWRSSAFHPKLLNDPEFMDMSESIKEDEMKYWYFESIGVGKSR